MKKTTNFQLYTIRLDESVLGVSRSQFIDSLAESGVAARVYYPALHRAPVFAKLHPGTDMHFPKSTIFSDTAVSLPIYPTMTSDEMDLVIQSVESSVGAARHQNA